MYPSEPNQLLRLWLYRLSVPVGMLMISIFLIHAVIRFAGLIDPQFYPLAMVVVWPLPWLLLNRNGRQKIGLTRPTVFWLLAAVVVDLAVVVAGAALLWVLTGTGPNNWFVSQARFLRQTIAEMPPGISLWTSFWFVTIPAIIFSPLAEEFPLSRISAALTFLIGGA